MRGRRLILTAAVIATVMLLAGACGGDDDSAAETAAPAAPTTTTTTPTTTSTSTTVAATVIAEWEETHNDGSKAHVVLRRIWKGPQPVGEAEGLPVEVDPNNVTNNRSMDPQRDAVVAVVEITQTNVTEGFDMSLPNFLEVKYPDAEFWLVQRASNVPFTFWSSGATQAVEWFTVPPGASISTTGVFVVPSFYSPASPDGTEIVVSMDTVPTIWARGDKVKLLSGTYADGSCCRFYPVEAYAP